MGIINIHGYCHARVHATVPHSSIFFSLFGFITLFLLIDHPKRVCGYIHKFPQGAIRFHVRIPDHESIFGTHLTKYDWMETVYGTPAEDIPSNALTAKGNPVHTTMYTDANLLH